ncbi:MAG TPA: hypothetical protein PLP88_11080, partial [Bacteroidales bacterium]|nr:hypothetical protein [Bacteroidales bacterium]
ISGEIVITLQPVSIFANPITGSSPGNSNPYTTNQTFNANISVSGIGRGTGVTGATGNDRYNTTGWTTTTSIDVNDYFEFILTPNLGYKINFDNLNFTFQRSNSGPSVFKVRTSLDAFNSDLGTFNNTGDNSPSNVTLQLTGAQFDDITSAITFRIYAHTAASSTATASINDFIFYGNVSCVQPIAYSVSGGGAYCSGGTGVEVGLSSSQIGVSYQLKLDGTNTGLPVVGTGLAISFGNQTVPGTYTVVGSNTNGSCNYTANMTGYTTVIVNPLPVAPTSASVDVNNFCANAGGNIELTAVGGSGTTLTWYAGGCGNGSAIGTGTPLVISKPTVSTTYYARWETASCGNSTCAIVEVTVNQPVTPSVTIAADPGTTVYNGTSVTFNPTPTNGGTPTYQWYKNNTPVSTNNTYTYIPTDGDEVYAVMTSSLNCVTSATATSNVITMDVTSEITWTGAVSSVWNNPGNWNPNQVPDYAHAHIPLVTNQPHISNSGNIPNSITLDAGAVLTIEDGGTLTLNTGTITKDNTTSDNLVVKSGGLLRHSYGSTNARIERVITPGHWHNISSPVVGAKSGVFESYFLMDFTTNGSIYNYITETDRILNPMQGYSVYVDGSSNFTAVFSGFTHYSSDFWYDVDVSNAGDKWNLVGNPFPWPIYWNLPSAWDKTNVDNAIYIENGGLWASYVDNIGTNGGTGSISSCQGFFVHATGTGPFSVHADAQTGTNGFLKDGDEIVPDMVRLEVSGNGFKDEAVVRLKPEATTEFDGNFDAFKLYGSEEKAPQLYSLGTVPLAINSIPEAVPVPVGVKASM